MATNISRNPRIPPTSRPLREEVRLAECANQARGSSRHSAKPARFAGISASAPSTIHAAP